MRYFNLFFSRCVKILHPLPLLALKVKQYCIAIKLFCPVHPHCPDKAEDILVWSVKITLVVRTACRNEQYIVKLQNNISSNIHIVKIFYTALKEGF